ncbi:MAG TPA: DUF2939 domain-containing protein [Caulobacteraceae bacterium]
MTWSDPPPPYQPPPPEPRRWPQPSLPRPGTIISLAFLLAVLGFLLAPWFAFRALREAARTDDVGALTQLVDYPAVRQSLRVQLLPLETDPEPPVDPWRDPVGAIKRALQPPPAAPPARVDAFLRPGVLEAITYGRPPLSATPETARAPFPWIRYWGFNRVRIGVKDPADKRRETEFVFQRRGIYAWKLVHVVLPRRPPGQPGVGARKPPPVR